MDHVNFAFPLTKEQQEKKKQLVAALLQKKQIQTWMKQHQVDASYIGEHSGRFSDWVNMQEKCEHCQGLTFCRQPQPGYVMDLYIDGFLTTQLKPCSYLKQQEEVDQHKSSYRCMDMPEELLRVEMISLDLKKESKEYRDAVSRIADHLLNEQEHKGVYFYGKPGVGKTYLAAGITNYFAQKKVPCAFVNVPKLISELKMMFQDNNVMEQRLRLLRSVDVLVLDDIGGESMTAWSRDDILLPILETRMQQKKRTYFTSNYSMLELKDRFETTNNRMKEPIAALRLIERIKALSFEIFIKGESRRF